MSEDCFHLGVKALIIGYHHKVLLLQRHPKDNATDGIWEFPGGRVQKDETQEETLKREVFEETGIEDLSSISPISMEQTQIRIPVGVETVGLILAIHRCEYTGKQEITLSSEHSNYQWVDGRDAATILKNTYSSITLNYLIQQMVLS